MRKKILFETFVPKSEISYTGMAYPLYAIRNNDYAHIFSEVMKINRMDPSPYEKIQQLLITELDKAQYVEIKGDNGNETNIRIALNDNLNRSCESNFVNCGADVNIPVGEVYTSPKLKGTNGLLHLQKIYISNIEFNDLKLKVENGFVVDYSCSNGDNLEESRQMIERYVLNGRKSLPLGEFALGTNTFAYSIVKKLGILHQLHTLIYEKLGPHIALGDTCFSWSEDNPICNQFDGKLIVGKDNEVSILRKEDPSKAYFGYHKDLTIPYDEIALIQAICEDGTNISILENGHFVLTGCEYLNQFLC